MKRVIIDTDLGIDDAHAVLMALLSPNIRIEGFTTVFGNTLEVVDKEALFELYLETITGSGYP